MFKDYTKVIKEQLLSTGGVTFHNGAIARYDYGYQVALDTTVEVVYERDEIDVMIDVVYKTFPDAGIWFDGENYIVDVVTVHISDRQDAMLIATRNNQRYIYDWENDIEIKVVR